MKRLYTLFMLLALICSVTVRAYDFSDRNKHNVINLKYQSIGVDNRPDTLSTAIFYPYSTKLFSSKHYPVKIKYVLLNNRPTIISSKEAPTGSNPFDGSQGGIFEHGIVSSMTSDSALVISPDLLGYGASDDVKHPYCCADITARNVIDAFFAALDTIRALGVEFNDDWYTINMGYSQGGATAMAVQRYLETKCTDAEREAFRLKKTVCGDGPYDLTAVYDLMVNAEKLPFPSVMPLIFEGMYAAYKEGAMKSIDKTSFYASPELEEALCNSFKGNQYTILNHVKYVKELIGKDSITATDIASDVLLDTRSPEYRAFRKVLEKNTIADGTWHPQTPILLYHGEDDDIVPFKCLETAVENLGCNVTYIPDSQLRPYINSVYDSVIDLSKNAFPAQHTKYGTSFYVYMISGLLF